MRPDRTSPRTCRLSPIYNMRGGCTLNHAAPATLLFSLVLLSAAAVLFYQTTVWTEWGREQLWKEPGDLLEIPSDTLGHLPRSYFVRGSSALKVVFWWGGPLLATLAAIALLQLSERKKVFGAVKGLTRLLSKQIWGYCLGELAMLAVFMGINVLGFHRSYNRYLEHSSMHKGPDFVEPPDWVLNWEGVSFALGYVSFMNFTVIFFPVSRNSPMFDLLGLSFEKRIKYHRWLSHLGMFILTGHGLLYWLLWLIRAEWIELALQKGSHTNNFAGGIAILFGWILWITSVEFFRRKYFEVFYRFHLSCFIGFAIFTHLHVPGFTTYMPAGLLLHAVDVVLRVVQQSAPVSVKSTVNSDGTVAELSVQAPKEGLSTIGVPVVWVSCPSISSCQWHPVTPIISTDGRMTIYFKTYGNWTKELSAKCAAGEMLHLHIEGPHDLGSNGFSTEFIEYKTLIFFAGGIAITPVLAILEALDNHEMKIKQDKPSIYVYWTVRTTSELEAGLSIIQKFIRYWQNPGVLTLEIYITGKNKTPNESATPLPKCRSDSLAVRLKSILRQYIGRSPASRLVPAQCGPWHMSLLYVVSYGAGFSGLLLGRAWRQEHLRAEQSVLLGHSNIVQFCLTMTMAIGWVTLCVLPLHILRSRRDKEKCEEGGKRDDFKKQKAKSVVASINVEEISEQRHIGRPNFHGILQTLKSYGAIRETSAVIAGGPVPMVTAARSACQAENISFHEASFEF